jgi:basic membrane protein A
MKHACLALAALLCIGALVLPSCKKPQEGTKIGLVTDVGGRGDESFNDSALRGLEMWAAGKRYTAGGYVALQDSEFQSSLPSYFAERGVSVSHLSVTPLVIYSKAQEDYEPNLELLVNQKVAIVIGVGCMLENAVEAAAKRHPEAKFLLIDSPICDSGNPPKPYSLPNVVTYTFREHEGAFLVGAIAGMVTKTGKIGFVGGMELPIIRKFEAGFKAGIRTTNPSAEVLVAYTGCFDQPEAGKKTANDQLSKGADIVMHASGSCGLGVIDACRDAGKFAIGVDSDQSFRAPKNVLTSQIKHVDLAVYETVRDVVNGTFTGKDVCKGLKEGAVGYAPIRVEIPDRQKVIDKAEKLRRMVIEGKIVVPNSPDELEKFTPPAGY